MFDYFFDYFFTAGKLKAKKEGGQLPIRPAFLILFLTLKKGYSLALNLKKTGLSIWGQKNVESFLIRIPLPKTQWRVKTLCHSPCDDTPKAATIIVTTCGVLLLSSKNIVFCFHTLHCGPRL
jgi:hypothetical protein